MICDDCKYLKVWATEKGKIKHCKILGSVKEATSTHCIVWEKKKDNKK